MHSPRILLQESSEWQKFVSAPHRLPVRFTHPEGHWGSASSSQADQASISETCCHFSSETERSQGSLKWHLKYLL